MLKRPASSSRFPHAATIFILAAIIVSLALLGLAVTRTALLHQTSSHKAEAVAVPSTTDFDATFLARTAERRCAVCHSCFDAPCQFRMTSAEGISRGASKQPIYNPSRINEAPLTRLGIDASTVEEWRKLGFYDAAPKEENADPAQSLLWRMLALGKRHPIPENAPLPKSVDIDITRELSCPTPTQFDRYERKNPFGGMPYAMAPLKDHEWESLSAWVTAGASTFRGDPPTNDALTRQIAEWEVFLNGDAPKDRLVARYLYEHLFLAHLYFSGVESRAFFELIRSSTPPGEPVHVIATRRPYDDPGTDDFYYRFEQITETIVHKTHMTYGLSPTRLKRLKELFLGSNWPTDDEPPSYEPSVASNPFVAFAAIPAEVRYRFLLDDPEYFIRTFIRGPVCSGQVAVNVIEDRFWVMFLAPESDLSITDPTYLTNAKSFLGLPAEHASGPLLKRLVPVYLEHHRQYEEFRKVRYDAADPKKLGPSIDAIWRGTRQTGPALLTVFRHFDNASVTSGFVGDIPETAWVIDFPTLERIYYNLVAGFDVFGPVEHQIGTRLYMDFLRMESEDLFLSFLPADIRRQTHEDWYRGGHTKIRLLMHQNPIDIDHGVQINFRTDDPKSEFLMKVLQRSPGDILRTDPINRSHGRRDWLSPATAALAPLASSAALWVQFLPEVSLLRITRAGRPDLVFSMLHDDAHTNVAFLFAESLRREPEKDEITIIQGQIASYPNFFFVVDALHLRDFVGDLTAIRNEEDWRAFVDEYGVRRSSPAFWETADFFQDEMIHQHPSEAGLLDLNRYVDP